MSEPAGSVPSSVSILITASVKSSIGSLRALVLPAAGLLTSGIALVSSAPGYEELFPEPISPIVVSSSFIQLR